MLRLWSKDTLLEEICCCKSTCLVKSVSRRINCTCWIFWLDLRVLTNFPAFGGLAMGYDACARPRRLGLCSACNALRPISRGRRACKALCAADRAGIRRIPPAGEDPHVSLQINAAKRFIAQYAQLIRRSPIEWGDTRSPPKS